MRVLDLLDLQEEPGTDILAGQCRGDVLRGSGARVPQGDDVRLGDGPDPDLDDVRGAKSIKTRSV